VNVITAIKVSIFWNYLNERPLPSLLRWLKSNSISPSFIAHRFAAIKLAKLTFLSIWMAWNMFYYSERPSYSFVFDEEVFSLIFFFGVLSPKVIFYVIKTDFSIRADGFFGEFKPELL
jgi:hypothetical protein